MHAHTQRTHGAGMKYIIRTAAVVCGDGAPRTTPTRYGPNDTLRSARNELIRPQKTSPSTSIPSRVRANGVTHHTTTSSLLLLHRELSHPRVLFFMGRTFYETEKANGPVTGGVCVSVVEV